MGKETLRVRCCRLEYLADALDETSLDDNFDILAW
jgi:hypothetical protein